MKTERTVCLCIVVSMLSGVLMAFFLFGANSFQEACHKGANARVLFRVLNDLQNPVAGAKVNVFFDMADRVEGRYVVGITDTNGVCVIEGKTVGVLKIEVSCQGYYRTKDELCFITMGHEHEVKNGMWQPWGMVKKIVLRPVRCPRAIRMTSHDWIDTKAINEWLGFDLEKYDFIAPIGKGLVKDVEIKFDWDGCYGTKHNGMAVSLRFPSPYAGGYYENKTAWSDFTGVYNANTNSIYSQEFHYERRPIRDAKGRIVGGVGDKFDQSKVLVVRSRCIVDRHGFIVSARYFLLSNLEFSCMPDGCASIRFVTTYNPTPNDTNLEPK